MTKSTSTEAAKREIRVLSVQQPAADSIFWFGKWCENRSWSTKYRGELFIHASKISPGESPAVEALKKTVRGAGMTGAIIGKVDLIDCVPLEELEALCQGERIGERSELAQKLSAYPQWTWQHVSGDICWILANPSVLKTPIPTGGKLNIWKFDAPIDQLKFHPVTQPVEPKAAMNKTVKCDPKDPLVKIAKKAILIDTTGRTYRFRTKLGIVEVSAAEYRLTEDYVSLVTRALQELPGKKTNQ